MKKRVLNTRTIALQLCIAAGIVFSYMSIAAAYTPPVTNRADLNFDRGWKYNQGDATGANTKAFSDASWQAVSLPHNTKWNTTEDKTAYLGISWYRKHFQWTARMWDEKFI